MPSTVTTVRTRSTRRAKRRRTFPRRRRNVRRRLFGRRRLGIPKGVVAKQKLIRMPYFIRLLLDPGASGGIDTKSFSLTKLHAPEPTPSVGAHQPMGYDELTALYQNYIVVGGKMKAYFHAPVLADGTSDNRQYMCGITTHKVGQTFSAPQGVRNLVERKRSNWGYLQSYASSKPQLNLKKKWSLKRLADVKNVKDDDGLRGVFDDTNFPTRNATGTVWATGIYDSAAVNPNSLYVHVMIEYIVLCFDPQQLNES